MRTRIRGRTMMIDDDVTLLVEQWLKFRVSVIRSVVTRGPWTMNPLSKRCYRFSRAVIMGRTFRRTRFEIHD